jgi:endopeptidase Clp ATP-binding regulatory subunit ClpX
MSTPASSQQVAAEVKRILDALGAAPKANKKDPERTEGGQSSNDFIAGFKTRPTELMAELQKRVIGQDEAIRTLSTKVCGHYNAIRSRLEKGANPMADIDRIKLNILLIGGTGSGKSYLLKLIAKVLGVPFIKVDATKFSQTGYVGGDVEDIIRDLARKTKKKDGQPDFGLAQYGIVFIDEVDKIASSNGSIGPDVSRRGVQQALLTLIEDADVPFKKNGMPDVEDIMMLQKIMNEGGELPPRTINTKNILFVFAGAFPELNEIIAKRLSQKQVGFGAEPKSRKEMRSVLKLVKTEDLVAFGFEPELIGRTPVRVVLNDLTEEHLFKILQNDETPVVTQFRDVMESYGIEIGFEDDALRYIASLAAAEGTGARGLLSAFESVVGVYETHLSAMPIAKVTFTLPMIDGSVDPLEFIECLKDGYDDWQNTEAAKELESGISGYVLHVKEKHGLELSFDEEAKGHIGRLASEKSRSSRDVCSSAFGECEAAFGLLAQKGRTGLTITIEAIENPMAFLEQAFKE